MISQVGTTALGTPYLGDSSVKSNTKQTQQMNKNADMSKVLDIKNSIQSGEYKMNLHAVSKRIADELLQ